MNAPTMKAAVALFLAIAMLGCFPHNPRHRTYAKYAEGGALVAGIAISAVANTGADCDERMMPGPNVNDSCRSTATVMSTVGVALILGGLLGFVATVSTAEDEEVKEANVQANKPSDDEKTQVKLPPGVAPSKDGQAAGASPSGAQSPSAPQP
jgi:hypothetical protein